MRFMIIVKATKNSEAGVLPSEKLLAEMTKYNEELTKAGVLLAGEGLQASSRGARVKFSGEKRTVTDGPFTETKELVAGFWLWKCKSLQEAIGWVKRCPNPMPGEEAEIETYSCMISSRCDSGILSHCFSSKQHIKRYCIASLREY